MSDAVERFAAALAAADEAAARAACDPETWAAPGDSPARVFRQLAGRTPLEPGEAHTGDAGRAAVECRVASKTLFALVGGEHIQAFTQSRAHADAFVAGTLPARVRYEEQPALALEDFREAARGLEGADDPSDAEALSLNLRLRQDRGEQLTLHEARAVGDAAVVRADWNGDEPAWLYFRDGRLYAVTAFFRLDTVLTA